MSAVLSRQSTGWALDFQRGLDDPASVAARQERITAANKAAACRAETVSLALGLLGSVAPLRPTEVAAALRTLANSLKPQVGDETRARLFALADQTESGE